MIRRFLSLLYDFIVSPVVYVCYILQAFIPYDHISQAISIIPFSIGMRIRRNFYKYTLKSCGEDCSFGFGTTLSVKDIEIGDNVRFGPYNTLGHVNFGNDVLTGGYCHFLSGARQHGYARLDIPMSKQPGKLITINIGNDVWIGINTVIMNSIGNGCISGSGSVVTKRIEDYSIVAGNPAKTIKTRLEQTTMET